MPKDLNKLYSCPVKTPNGIGDIMNGKSHPFEMTKYARNYDLNNKSYINHEIINEYENRTSILTLFQCINHQYYLQ